MMTIDRFFVVSCREKVEIPFPGLGIRQIGFNYPL